MGLKALVGALGLALATGAVIALVIMVRSYWNERRDYARTPSSAISQDLSRARVPGLVDIAFAAEGGPRLASWYAPPGVKRAAVVLVHGVGGERSSLLFETQRLASAGFGVLTLDLPGQGASAGKTEWGIPERRAISAAVDWLRGRDEVDPGRIGAFGMSMGAYLLAQAAVADVRIAAVVLAATPNDVVEFNWLATRRWGLLSQYPTYWALRAGGTPLDDCPKDILGRLAPRPVLVVQGERDEWVPEWMARQLYAAAHEPKDLYIVRGAGHANFASAVPIEYGARLVEFFDRTLLSHSPNSPNSPHSAADGPPPPS